MIHSYPWYPADWRASEEVLSMTMEAQGIYRNLLDMCWTDGSLPADERTLRRLALAEPDEWERSWCYVRHMFTEGEDGRLHHAKVDERRPELMAWHDQRREAAKRSARTRRERMLERHANGTSGAVQTAREEPLQRDVSGTSETVSTVPEPSTSTSASPPSSSSSSSDIDKCVNARATPLVRYATDEDYLDTIGLIEAAVPADTFVRDDWATAYRHWTALDYEQRQVALANWLARIESGENPTYLKPQLILRGTEWQRRPATGRPPRVKVKAMNFVFTPNCKICADAGYTIEVGAPLPPDANTNEAGFLAWAERYRIPCDCQKVKVIR